MEEASLVRENMTHMDHERAVRCSRCMCVRLSACLVSLYIYIYAYVCACCCYLTCLLILALWWGRFSQKSKTS